MLVSDDIGIWEKERRTIHLIKLQQYDESLHGFDKSLKINKKFDDVIMAFAACTQTHQFSMGSNSSSCLSQHFK